jgi:hypothetical protein
MHVEIQWRVLKDDRDPGWNKKQVLYAYLSPDLKEVLFIGKAFDTSVRDRWNHAARKGFWEGLENQRGIATHQVIIGELHLSSPALMSEELLADIENTLIVAIAPWGNQPLTDTPIAQEDLHVKCAGGWDGWKTEYVHAG